MRDSASIFTNSLVMTFASFLVVPATSVQARQRLQELQRTLMFDPLTNPKLFDIADLNWRETVIFAPLILGTLALGLQPGVVFAVTNAATEKLVAGYQLFGG